MAIVHENKFLLSQICGYYRLLMHQCVVRWQAKQQLFAEKLFDLNVRIRRCITDQREIDLIFLETTQKLLGGLLVKN